MDEQRMNRLRENDKFYCSMLDLVQPDNFGFEEDVKEQLRLYKHQLVDRKLNEFERKKLSSSGKQLLSRLDFDQPRTVTDIWAWLDKQQPSNSHVPQTPSANGVAGSESVHVSGQMKEVKDCKKVQFATNDEKREALVIKLQGKLASMHTARKNDKLTQEEKRERRKKRDVKRKVNRLQDALNNGSAKVKEEIGNAPKQGPIKNDRGQVVYSKFDFAVPGVFESEKKGAPNRLAKRKKEFSGKNFQKLLDKVEEKEENFRRLKATNPEKAAHVQQREKWQRAMERTAGVKIKDDKKVLKANLKKQQKRKTKSKEEWTRREESVQAKIDKKQEKRRENIRRRVDDKRKHKIERARKKGRFVLPS